jgi:hypothetical protein
MSRAGVFGALAVAAGLALGGCSSDSDGSSGDDGASASSAADLCASADALRSSIGDLSDVQVVQDGTEALRQASSEVGDDMDQLADDARNEFGDQVSGVESAAGDLRTAIEALGSDPSVAALGDVDTAVRALVDEAGVLLDDVGASC